MLNMKQMQGHTHTRMLLDALVDVYLETATGNGKLMDRIKINLPTQSTR